MLGLLLMVVSSCPKTLRCCVKTCPNQLRATTENTSLFPLVLRIPWPAGTGGHRSAASGRGGFS